MIHQKKNMGQQASKIVKSRKSYSEDCLMIVHFITQFAHRCMTWSVNLGAQLGCVETIKC